MGGAFFRAADFFEVKFLRHRPCARVRAAFFAEAERLAALRLDAARWACRDNAVFDAARRGSRFNAFSVARERVRDGLCG